MDHPNRRKFKKVRAAALSVAGMLAATMALAYGYPKIKEVWVGTSYGQAEAWVKIKGTGYGGKVRVEAKARITEKCRTRGNGMVVEPHTTVLDNVRFEGEKDFARSYGVTKTHISLRQKDYAFESNCPPGLVSDIQIHFEHLEAKLTGGYSYETLDRQKCWDYSYRDTLHCDGY